MCRPVEVCLPISYSAVHVKVPYRILSGTEFSIGLGCRVLQQQQQKEEENEFQRSESGRLGICVRVSCV